MILVDFLKSYRMNPSLFFNLVFLLNIRLNSVTKNAMDPWLVALRAKP